MFDLGVRRDWENYAPRIVSLIKATTQVTPGSDVASVLDSDRSGLGIRSRDIEAVIWSHNHFDHIGDISTFSPSTALVVGPGVRAASWPGYPSNPDAAVLDSDARGREIREISFDGIGLRIGRFEAFDFFGDGSFYLLNAPGHAVGHLCALARTTASSASSSSSFVFMGADACHHPGVLRPTEYLPLPRSLALPSLGDAGICPGALLQRLLPGQDPRAPFFTVARGPLFPDHEASMETVRKIQELDAADNVFVVMAHDRSLQDRIPLFPEKINDWRAKNLRPDTRWLFCSDFEGAVQAVRNAHVGTNKGNRLA